ncbi:hypothetical protein DY705_25185 [Salmonella enterica]|nr:hypothetical protein [Salmonella enterica]
MGIRQAVCPPRQQSLYIDLCNCLILICSIQHQEQVNLWMHILALHEHLFSPCVRRGVVHKSVFYQAYSVTTRIKRPTAWSGRSVAA